MSPAPPPIPRPVEEVMQDFTVFSDPVSMMGERPPGSVKDAAEYYLQLFQPGGQLPRIFETTRIYDRTGILLAEISTKAAAPGWNWTKFRRISSMPPSPQRTPLFSSIQVSTPRRIVGAAIQRAREAGEVVSGASTITMQTARALFLLANSRYNQSMERKSIEVEMARQLSARFSGQRDSGNLPESCKLRPYDLRPRSRQPGLLWQIRGRSGPWPKPRS